MAWRFDPAKGGVYDDSEDDDKPAIAADTTVMPNAGPLTFAAGSGGGAPAPAAPTPPAQGGETFGIPNTTTPITLTGDTSHTNVNRKVMTAEDALAQGAQANAYDAQADALRTQGEIEAKQKLDEGDTHDKRAGVYETSNKLRATAIRETDEQKVALATKAAQLQKTIDGTKITDGWATMSTGDKVLAGLALIVNGIGRGLAGDHGPDHLFAAMQERIKRDHDEQIRRVDVMRKQLEHLNGPAREQAEKELKLKLDNIEAAQIGQLSAVAEQGNALAARTGSPLVIAKMGEKMGEIQAKAAEKRQDFLDKTRTEIQGGTAHESKEVRPTAAAGGGKPSENEAQLALAAKSIHRDLDTLKKFPLKPGTLEAVQNAALSKTAAEEAGAKGTLQAAFVNLGRDVGWVPRSVVESLPKDQQQAVQATIRARQSADLIMSGKGMPESERQERGLTMIPQPGEDPETWSAKLENLRAFATDAEKLAGPGAEARLNGAVPAGGPTSPAVTAPARSPAPAKPAAAAPGATKQLIDKKTGKPITAYQHANGKWYDAPEAP